MDNELNFWHYFMIFASNGDLHFTIEDFQLPVPYRRSIAINTGLEGCVNRTLPGNWCLVAERFVQSPYHLSERTTKVSL